MRFLLEGGIEWIYDVAFDAFDMVWNTGSDHLRRQTALFAARMYLKHMDSMPLDKQKAVLSLNGNLLQEEASEDWIALFNENGLERISTFLMCYFKYGIRDDEAAKEFFLLNMRLYQGIDIKDFAREFGIEVAKMYLEPLRKYVEHGYVSIKGDIYSFTEKGMLVSSYIKTEVLAEVDKILEESGENTSNETAESSSDADSFI